jgi:hypothetical protein
LGYPCEVEWRDIEVFAEALRRTLADRQAWEAAELHVLGCLLRERLELLGIPPGPDAGAVLMVVTQLLSERTPEWGGDARDVLGEVALLGLDLLDFE